MLIEVKDGPFAKALEENLDDGVLMKEVVIHKIINGLLVRQIHTREYSQNKDDWNDRSSSKPLCKTK